MKNKLKIPDPLEKKKKLTRKIFQVIIVRIFPKVRKEQIEVAVLQKKIDAE